ncbi:MAG: FUSC family protein [Thermomonas sp.]
MRFFGNLTDLRPRDVPWRVALRNTVAVIAPLAIGIAIGQQAAGLAGTSGALNTMFSDQPGPYRLRMARMFAAALGAGLAALLGILVGDSLPWAMLAVVAFSLVGGMMVALGPMAARVGLTSLIVLLITADMRLPASNAPGVALAIFGGGLLQMLFALAAWPLQRYRPERFALASVLEQLAQAARTPSDPNAPPPASQAASDVVETLHGEYRARGIAVQAFRVLAETCERARVELVTLGDIGHRVEDATLRERLRGVTDACAVVFDALADGMRRAEPVEAEPLLAAYTRAVSALDAAIHGDMPARDRRLARIARARAQGLGGQLRALARNSALASSRGEIEARSAEARLPAALRPADPFNILRANLKLSSVALRHALRCTAIVALSFAVERALAMSHGVWLPMTAAIVLKPDFGGTLRFGVQRTLGTFAGLLVASVLIHYGMDSVVARLALMALLCLGFRLYAQANYALAVALLTGLLVLLFSFEGVAPAAALEMRIIATVLAAVLALGAYLAWPTWESERVQPALAKLIECYRQHLRALLASDMAALHETRNASRSARTNVLASLERLRAEPHTAPVRRTIERAESMLSNANRLIRAVIPIEAMLIDGAKLPTLPELDRFAGEVDAALLAIATGLRRGQPQQFAPLRPAERTLAARLQADDGDDAVDAALADACDRIADSIDSLGHILRGARAEAAMAPAAAG